MRALIAGILLLALAGPGQAAPGFPHAVRAQVPADRWGEVEDIIAAPTFVRTLELEAPVDPRVFTYLLDHPDLNAALARALAIAPYNMVRIGPREYRGDDGGGNTGTIEIFGDEGSQRVFIERGVSPGWWFGDIGGRVVALVTFSTEHEGVRGTVMVWAHVDHGLVDRLVRILKPFLGGFLDGKLREQFGITFRAAEAAAQNAGQFCGLLGALSEVSPDDRRALAERAGCREGAVVSHPDGTGHHRERS